MTVYYKSELNNYQELVLTNDMTHGTVNGDVLMGWVNEKKKTPFIDGARGRTTR